MATTRYRTPEEKETLIDLARRDALKFCEMADQIVFLDDGTIVIDTDLTTEPVEFRGQVTDRMFDNGAFVGLAVAGGCDEEFLQKLADNMGFLEGYPGKKRISCLSRRDTSAIFRPNLPPIRFATLGFERTFPLFNMELWGYPTGRTDSQVENIPVATYFKDQVAAPAAEPPPDAPPAPAAE